MEVHFAQEQEAERPRELTTIPARNSIFFSHPLNYFASSRDSFVGTVSYFQGVIDFVATKRCAFDDAELPPLRKTLRVDPYNSGNWRLTTPVAGPQRVWYSKR
jgi:hypothetical protein